ncbi:MAG: phenylalanine--tRNA ligase subunit alpha [Bacteroidia bacterium]|nr:phenylalanine--tRNA ligase subunit alpha [Bacteroidia bacterium]
MNTEKFEKLLNEIGDFIPETKESIESFRIKFLGKKGVLTDLFAQMKDIEPALRKEFGQRVNEIKQHAEAKLETWRNKFDDATTVAPNIDLSLPAEPLRLGSAHPLTIVRQQIIDIFIRMGYTLSEGPEIEDDWHNFSALNFPPNHPARDMQDTFFISDTMALRTHTSSVQVRVMENKQPPIRTISPGRVYRNEAISARAHCFFHQVEGLYIDEGVSFADMKQTLLHFAQEMFGAQSNIRLRASYFPFTEPSAEMDVTCFICNGKGCNICKGSGWVEILGCGMVDPAVLTNCGIDAEKYTGFAFGMGIERITMLKYQIKDLRIFSENNVRFLQQFSGMN